MPRRKTPLVNGEVYHVFNRSIYRQPIFNNKTLPRFFLKAIEYYTQAKPPVKFSYYRKSPQSYQSNSEDRLVTIISYCLMPTHFHLTLRQNKERGIQLFMQKVQNSFSHYYRTRYGGKGPLFESTFRVVHVVSDGQLVHLTRYHHLNPVTSWLVEHPKDYPYSSYNTYIGRGESPIIDSSYVLSHFKTSKDYEKFVMDRKDYQRELEKIKHLIFE